MSNDRIIEIIIETNDRTGGALGGLQETLLRLDRVVQRTHQRLRTFATTRYAATLNLIDRVTEPGSRINEFLRSMATRAYRATIRLNDRTAQGIRELESRLMRVAGKAYTVAVNLKDNISGKLGGLTEGVLAGAGIMAGTAGIGFGVVNAFQSQMDFEKQMSAVAAVGGSKSRQVLDRNGEVVIDVNTGKARTEFDLLTAKAKEMGATTQFTAKEAAEALYYMGMAGWKTQQQLSALPAVLDLAAASATELGRTSDIVTDTMTGFGVRAGTFVRNEEGQLVEATQHYTDLLATTVTNANTDLEGIYEASKYSAPLIQAMYASQDDTAKMNAARDSLLITGLMANAGVKGSQAGTAQRAMMTRLEALNSNAEYARQVLGVEMNDENGQTRGLKSIIDDFRRKFNEGYNADEMVNLLELVSGESVDKENRGKMADFVSKVQKNGGKMTDADKIQMSSLLAGQEAMSGWLSVFLAGEEDVNSLYEALSRADGKAREMSEIQMDNLAGSFTMLESAWDAFQRSFVEGKAGDGLRSFIDAATEVVTRANKLFEDGIDVGDFAVIIGDVIDRLKNKFLEFDGIGSILAGGVLIGSLMKIGSKVRSVMDSIRELRGLNIGDRTNPPSGGGGRGLGGGQSVSTMTVHANVVNINTRSQGTPPPTGGGNGGNGGGRNDGTPPTRGQRIRSGARAGLVGGLIFAGLDVLSSKSQSEENVAAADEKIQAAKEQYQALADSGVATEQDLAAQREVIQQAEQEKSQVIEANDEQERKTTFGAAGMVAGSAIGAAIGSVIPGAGTAIGGMIGGFLGQSAGEFLADVDFESLLAGLGDALTPLAEKFMAFGQWVGEAMTSIGESISSAGEWFIGLGETISAGFDSAVEAVTNFGAAILEGFASMGETIIELVSAAMETVAETFSQAASTVEEVWGAMSSFFEGVFSSLGSIAAAAGSSIASGINSGIAIIQGAWEGLSSWLSGKIASLKNLASQAAAAIGFGGSERAMAEGGFVTSPQHILAGEAGTEVIIPLSSSKRSRAVDLIRKAIDFIGGDSSALDPISPMEILPSDEDLFEDPPIGLPNPNNETPRDLPEISGGKIEVNVGGVSIEFNVDGAQNPQDFMTSVKENLADMADQVGGQIAEQVRKIFHNQPLMRF